MIIPPLVKHSDSILVYSVGSCCLLFLSSYLRDDSQSSEMLNDLLSQYFVIMITKQPKKIQYRLKSYAHRKAELLQGQNACCASERNETKPFSS